MHQVHETDTLNERLSSGPLFCTLINCVEKAFSLRVNPPTAEKNLPFVITSTKLIGGRLTATWLFRSYFYIWQNYIYSVAYDTVAKCQHESWHGFGIISLHFSHRANSILYFTEGASHSNAPTKHRPQLHEGHWGIMCSRKTAVCMIL